KDCAGIVELQRTHERANRRAHSWSGRGRRDCADFVSAADGKSQRRIDFVDAYRRYESQKWIAVHQRAQRKLPEWRDSRTVWHICVGEQPAIQCGKLHVQRVVRPRVSYATNDNAGANNCNVNNGNAASRCDYTRTIGTLNFAPGESIKTITIPLTDDAYAEGNENFTVNLTNATGAFLGSPNIATITITDNESTAGPNPIDAADFFVHQHYIDFLGREPDASGYQFWINQILVCGNDPQCIEVRRINVSASFFLSIEFQQTGFFAERAYKAAY